MMDLKLWLSILMVCEMAESIGSGKDWLIAIPNKISVLEGSCVVVPCMFDYPKRDNSWAKWRGYWSRGDETVASNNPKFKETQEFKGRSRITGTLEGGNCTWQLDDVRESDAGPFYLTIEIIRLSKHSFSQDPMALDVFRDPKPPEMTVSVNKDASATCQVTHACPLSPPKFSWSHGGNTKTSSKMLKKGLWSTMSTLTFTPQEADFNKPLKCTVNYNDKKTAEGSVLVTK